MISGPESKADKYQAPDEDANPFSQWQSLEVEKEAEMQQRATKRQTARQAQFVSRTLNLLGFLADDSERRQRTVGEQSNAQFGCGAAPECRPGL